MCLQVEKRYHSDLTVKEWRILRPLLPEAKPGGRPRKHALLEIINAILYVLVSGCQWRMLPKDFPPWKTVYHYFRAWTLDGTWEQVHDQIVQMVRLRRKRDPHASAGILDSQSVKTAEKGGVVDSTVGKRLKVVNATSWSIRSA